jgi:rubrerythrin
LALAQAFEDTGVRAYKGQAANLMSKPDLLTAALQIHSVEARHASEVRRLRGQKDGLLVKIVEDCGSGSRNL